MPPATLPILQFRSTIVEALRAHRVIVLCGETGSGKTTQLPQICYEMGLAQHGMIAHTQPRRLAARSVASRIADEMNVPLGGLVGVKVRFQDRTSRDTRIKLLTDGMLLAELASDPRLLAYSTIIIDEAHERSLNIDFLLGYLRNLLPQRPDLKLIVTSATIDPQRFSEYFGGPSAAPIIEVSGRMFPVEIRYQPDDRSDDDPGRVNIESVADAVEELLRPSRTAGDVLVFLPGEREIRLAADTLRRRAASAEVLPLFARLTNQEQDRIFQPSSGSSGGAAPRRVILATNIAETSLTVPGIRSVVDTGVARLNRYDPERKVQRLPIEPISRASANQRSGRCGRVAEGVCIRLYSEDSYRARPVFTDPEIRRSSLASVVLQMKSLGLPPIDTFPFLDPPDARAITDAHETLFELGALQSHDPSSPLTQIGRDLASLPLDPRIGRILLAGEREKALREATILAAALSIQDPRERPLQRQEEADRAQLVFRNETSDFLTLLNLWEQYSHAARTFGAGELRSWCRDRFVSATRMREWMDTARQLADLTEELELKFNDSPAPPDAIHRTLLTGLISNVACRTGDAGSFEYRGIRGNTISIFPGSVLFKKAPKWIMAAEVVQTTRLFARTVAKIEIEWMEELAAHMFDRRFSDRHLDPQSGEPSAWERVTMSGVVVVPRRRTALAPFDQAAARDIFLREGLAQAKWQADLPFLVHNRRILEEANEAQARLRRRGLLRSDDELAAWFAARVPAEVHDPASFLRWRASVADADARVSLRLEDCLLPEARAALDASLFPASLDIESTGEAAPLRYALASGSDEDGVTVSLTLADLAALPIERPLWLVPGFLPDVISAMFKSLPKATRTSIEALGDLEALARECAAVMSFGVGSLPASLSETLEVLHSLHVPPEAWNTRNLPPHLRLRLRVVDENGKELGVDRDIEELHRRFEGRIRKLRAAQARAGSERENLTSWDFGDLPEQRSVERGEEVVTMYPSLIDERTHVRLTLLESSEDAAVQTVAGVRRLYSLACRDEIQPLITGSAGWADTTRHYQQLGTSAQLLDEGIGIIADRVFMAGRPLPRSQAQFEERLYTDRGRLAPIAYEVIDAVARMLDFRAKVAHRLASGTPRIWADSIADIREHAAYLMPQGFLRCCSWDVLRHYPRWAEAMRERLFSLRESGSGTEKPALQQFAPHWKRFTGWVAAAMAEERSAAPADEPSPAPTKPGKAPLPQTRRNSPKVNVDAGVWAITPGNLTPAVAQYRWALEDLRVALFAPDLAARPVMTPAAVEALWKKIEPAARR